MTFILVPEDGTRELRGTLRASQLACRVAYEKGFTPLSPSLYTLGFMSPGEMSVAARSVAQRWLRRCDRIWLQFPDDDREELDTLGYVLLEENQRLSQRRPVYLLQHTGDAKVGYVPMPMNRDLVEEILATNLTAGLARQCI